MILKTVIVVNHQETNSTRSFDRDLVSCHGKITLASDHSYLVEGVSKFENATDNLTLQNTELSAPPAYYVGDSPAYQM